MAMESLQFPRLYRALTAHPTRRAAFTLPEVLVVLIIMSILLTLAAVRIGVAADRSAVRAAVADAAAVFSAARHAAILRRMAVAVRIDSLNGTVEARADTALIVRRQLSHDYGVRIVASRDTMAFDSRGLGIGAANLSLVARRGRATDTLFLSRLGRVRY